MSPGIVERFEAPVIEDQEQGTRDGAHDPGVSTIAAGGGEIGEELGDTLFQRHVARALDGPCLVLLHEDGADQPVDGLLVEKDADDGGPRDEVIDAIMCYGQKKAAAGARTARDEEIMRAILGGGAMAATGAYAR